MSAYTPTPWRIGDAGTAVFGPRQPDALPVTVAQSVQRANASRIVACVNACEGMADPAAEIAELRAQRDTLAAALRNIADADYGTDTPKLRATARAALAKLEG